MSDSSLVHPARHHVRELDDTNKQQLLTKSLTTEEAENVSKATSQHLSNFPVHEGRLQANDEIDLIEVLQALWGLKNFCLGGIAFGALAAFTLVPAFFKPTYTANLPIHIDVQSLPAITTKEEVVKKVNEELGTERADILLSEAIGQKFPELMTVDTKNAKSEGPPSLLFNGRFASDQKDLPVQILNSVGTGQFMLSVKLPTRIERLDEFKTSLVSGLNTLMIEANEKSQKVYDIQNQALLENSRELSESSGRIISDSKNLQKNLIETATQIQSIEFKLSQAAGGLSKEGALFLKNSERSELESKDEKPFASIPAHTIMYKQSSERLSRALTLLALLGDEKLLESPAIERSKNQLIELQASLDASYSKRLTLEKVSESASISLSDALNRRHVPIEKSKVFLPTYEISSKSSFSSQDALVAKPGRNVVFAASVFLFGFAGLVLGFGIKILPRLLHDRK